MASSTKEIAIDIPLVIRFFKDGTVERMPFSPFVPSDPDPNPETSVSSRDVTISQTAPLYARIFLPRLAHPDQKLPVLVYFHGGGFCAGSAFSSLDTCYLSRLASEANVIGVSVEYRLAPEHPLPVPYEDCWTALQWVAAHSMGPEPGVEKDPWLLSHADIDRVFIGGDSAGGNIAHNMCMRAGAEELKGGVKILGAFLTHPLFWSSKRMGTSDSMEEHEKRVATMWGLVYPRAEDGVDNTALNPVGEGKPSLAALGCRRMLVCVAEKDEVMLRDRGVWYYEKVKESGWEGEIELVEYKGELHSFHISTPQSENAAALIKKLASFMQKK